MNRDLEFLTVILQERLKRKDTSLFVSFDGVKRLDAKKGFYTTQGFYYESEMRAGIPETCAVQIYIGTGGDPDYAFENMVKNVKNNNPIKTEVG